MKLRIRGNSIRIRVSQSEVAAIAAEGRVEETIQFSAQKHLRYGVLVSEDGPAQVSYQDDQIMVELPAGQVQAWLAPDQVGIEAEQNLGAGEALAILVEKDFTCLAPREGEDDSDTFPNPKAT